MVFSFFVLVKMQLMINFVEHCIYNYVSQQDKQLLRASLPLNR